MKFQKHFKGLIFFKKALKEAKSDMWASLQVLILLTIVIALIQYFVEHSAQPEKYEYPWDSMVWGFMSYLGNPGHFSPGEPVTLVGRYLAVVIAIIKILIFAVPAGLVAKGFKEAMAKDKREEKLCKFRLRLRKSFRRSINRSLRSYLNTLPDKDGNTLSKINVVPSVIPVAKIQVKQSMDLRDIMDAAEKFPEFRLKNQADAMSEEECPEDRILVEHFPVNTRYGCCINRQSKITIVSPSSFDEVGTGWFLYYVAKFGGFNYISKDLEIDIDETDSFYNLSPQPLYDKKDKERHKKEKSGKKILEILDEKQKNRDAFINDLKSLAKNSENPWIIVSNWHIKNSENTADFHFVDNNKGNNKSTVTDTEMYEKFFSTFSKTMKEEMGFESVKTKRYPFQKNFLLYRLKEDYDFPPFNGFALKPSSHIIYFDSRKLQTAFRMAEIINKIFDCPGPSESELADIRSTGFGYIEQEVDKKQIYIMDR